MRRACLFFFVAISIRGLFGQSAGLQSKEPIDPDEGTLSSVRLRIPEPMVFDLVRPLGAKRGELEVNSLFNLPAFSGETALHWAPEIEYAVADGFGIELELPMRNGAVESYKAAIQATLPNPGINWLVHGVQAIGDVAKHGDAHQVDLLHLLGLRWSDRWSSFSMTGVRREHVRSTGFALLANHSVFFEPSRTVAVGVETNWKGTAIEPASFLFMPQVHWRRTRLNIQAGAGFGRQAGSSTALVSWRISREF